MNPTALRFQNMPPLKTYSVVELAGIAYHVGNRVEVGPALPAVGY